MARILIADDHPIVLDGIASLFGTSDLTIVGRCTTGEAALRAVETQRPDILILDVRMPDPSGLDILRTLRARRHPARVVLLTASIADGQALEAIELGVDGLVLKETAPRQLLECVETIRAGGRWLDQEIVRRVLQTVLRKEQGRPVEALLTRREIEIVRLTARGLRNKEIARHMSITEGTVKMHLHNVYEKLNVGSRTELALFARDHGLG